MEQISEGIREIIRELSEVLSTLHMQRRDHEPSARILDRSSEELAEMATALRTA
jgi:hypothetical protein